MRIVPLTLLAASAVGLAGCATQSLPPTEVIRYHLGAPIARGSIAVQPVTSGAPASLEFQTYAAAVQQQLLLSGYTLAAPGMRPDFLATVGFTRANRVGPPRRSPISIGLGAGGFSGGGYRGGGGVGLGGGVGFPVGGGGNTALVVTELSVTIKHAVDQSPIWEGHARTVANVRSADSDAPDQANKLARAMFTGFPGESGRTIEVK